MSLFLGHLIFVSLTIVKVVMWTLDLENKTKTEIEEPQCKFFQISTYAALILETNSSEGLK